MRTLGIAFGSLLIMTAVVVACGGHDAVDVLGTPAPFESTTTSSGGGTSGLSSSSTSSTGGTSTSSTSSTSSSTGGTVDACAPCGQPPAGCTLIQEPNCKCSYRCADAGGPLRCKWSKDVSTCPDGTYCAAEGCGEGVCVTKGTVVTDNEDIQCGCDGVTYWNRSLAAAAGMPIRNNNACQENRARCGGLTGLTCGAGQSCNMLVKEAQCPALNQAGSCWLMPAQCPPVASGKAKQCGINGACTDECTAIKKQSPWFPESCP